MTDITPEVRMDSVVKYLIRIDGEEVAFADSEREAELIIDSLADKEEKSLTNEYTRVFRRNLEMSEEDDLPHKIVLSTQSLGNLYNGALCKAFTVDFIAVNHVSLTRPRQDLSNKKNRKTTVPIPAVLERLAEQKNAQDLPELENVNDKPSKSKGKKPEKK